MGDPFKNNIELQFGMYKQFCQSSVGGYYKAKKFDLLFFNDFKKCERYSTLWNDFVSIRINLFEKELSLYLLNELKCNKSQLETLNKDIKSYRNQCLLLPVNGDNRNFPYEKSWIHWIILIRALNISGKNKRDSSSISDLDAIYLYCVIYNGICALLLHSMEYTPRDVEGMHGSPIKPKCEKCYGFGFKIRKLFGYDNNGIIEKNKVKFIRMETEPNEDEDKDEEGNKKNKIKDEDKPKLNIKRETVCELLEEYLLNEFTQTNVFGRYINENGFEKHDSSSYHLSQKDEEIIVILVIFY